jgi:hypothetical protein
MLPIIALTFANDQDEHLDLLKAESSQLKWTLFPLDDKGAIKVVHEESAGVDDIIRIFQEFDRRILIFHYGGHAGGHGLRLEQGAAHAEGLAAMFKQQAENLQLVFLNGCSTRPQVDRLLELGVKAVIATSCPIQDPMAKEFSEYFYKWLVGRQSIEGAFESASAAIRTKYQDVEKPIIEIRQTRGLQKLGKAEKPEEFPWGLYVNEAHKEVLNWRLPTTPKAKSYAQQQSDYQPNQYLKYVLDAMLFLDDRLAGRLCDEEGHLVDAAGNPMNDQQKFYLILQNLPWLIGAPFQKLIALKSPTLERLKQITSTYLISSQTLLYIIISQLWNRQDLSAKKKANLLDTLDLTRGEFLVYDYMSYVKRLYQHEYFDQSHPPFVREIIPFLEELNDSESELFKAYLHLESLRDMLCDEEIPEAEAPAHCEEAESSLTVLLSRIAFLVSYTMIAVREIEIINYPHSEIEYRHRLGELNGIGDSLGLSPRMIKQHTCCDSILLTRQLEDLDDPERLQQIVNLSPLIIDENAFLRYTTDSLNIHMFAFKEGDTYYYYKVNGNLFNILQNEEKLLAISATPEDPEVTEMIRFLPQRQGSFLSASGSAVSGYKRPQRENPYARVIEQFESVWQNLQS